MANGPIDVAEVRDDDLCPKCASALNVKRGIEIRYKTRAISLIYDGVKVSGVRVKQDGKPGEIHGKTVVLACGGFEANPEWRTRYLGPGWELVKVRGTRFNQGDGLRMALEIGAAPFGNWSGCHAVGWDRNAPEFGDLDVGDQFEKHSYIFGLLINSDGKRFVDEGLDFHSFTYAKYGGEVLKQPAQFAWQVFDSKVTKLLRSEYRIKMMTKVSANTLEELATKLEGVNPQGFLKTVREYNASVKKDVPFDHVIKDGKCTVGIEPPKSNWAQPLDTPPFDAYATTCGITFTFGGLRIDRETGQVLNVHFHKIPGLYCAGEMVGGLFYFNYPAGTGLVSGTVFGRIAGLGAAAAAKARSPGPASSSTAAPEISAASSNVLSSWRSAGPASPWWRPPRATASPSPCPTGTSAWPPWPSATRRCRCASTTSTSSPPTSCSTRTGSTSWSAPTCSATSCRILAPHLPGRSAWRGPSWRPARTRARPTSAWRSHRSDRRVSTRAHARPRVPAATCAEAGTPHAGRRIAPSRA